jgi:hypothetical protein
MNIPHSAFTIPADRVNHQIKQYIPPLFVEVDEQKKRQRHGDDDIVEMSRTFSTIYIGQLTILGLWILFSLVGWKR